ncbi:MAG: recombinase RecA [Oscillospiraceae bacterium]|nr:recombinase RecA [Oscillospiraceae bacterium]
MAVKKQISLSAKPATAEEKKQALETALEKIELAYGKGAIMRLGENHIMNVNSVSTGSLGLDMALGIGGVPKGRIVEIFGHESSGKTTVALQIVAKCQAEGGYAAFIDVENALDPLYAKALGVNIDELLVSQPDSGEQALELAETLVRSGAIDIVVVDSVAAMVTKAEIDGNMGDSHVGLQARLMSQAMRKLTAHINKYDCVAVFINQIREMIGGNTYGGPATTTPGGRALKFYSSVRIEVKKGTAIMAGNEQIGSRTRCKVVKNKVAPPFKEVEFDLIFGKGCSFAGEILDHGQTLGIIKASGAWFSYGTERLGMGRETARKFLEENPDLAKEIAEKIMAEKDKLLFVYHKSGRPLLKESKEAKVPKRETKSASIDVSPDEEDFTDEE